MTTVAELTQELSRLSRQMEPAQQKLVEWSVKWAEAERDYRKARAIAYAAIRQEKLVAGDREAQVDFATADLRHTRDHAEAMKYSASQVVQNLRAQLSAVQSIGASIREEMRMSI